MGSGFSVPGQTGRGAHPSSCTMGTVPFLGVKGGRDVMLTPHTLLVPWSRKSRAIPLLPLWAVRPVQNLSAYTKVHFTLTFTCTANYTAQQILTFFLPRTSIGEHNSTFYAEFRYVHRIFFYQAGFQR